jgi:hypothetical protein
MNQLEESIEEGATCCIPCYDTGYIIWRPMMTPQGTARGIILTCDPKRDTHLAKDIIIEKCDCPRGQLWGS